MFDILHIQHFLTINKVTFVLNLQVSLPFLSLEVAVTNCLLKILSNLQDITIFIRLSFTREKVFAAKVLILTIQCYRVNYGMSSCVTACTANKILITNAKLTLRRYIVFTKTFS